MPAIDIVEVAEAGPDGQRRDHALQSLARWFLSAARSIQSRESHGATNELKNDLDVLRAAKVMSERR